MARGSSASVDVQFNHAAASKEGRQHVSAHQLKEAF